MAAGAGWAWLRDGDEVTHVTGRHGPHGPLTAVVDRVPVLQPGDRVHLDTTRAETWSVPTMPPAASPDAIAEACLALRPHAWNDPRALALATTPFDESVHQLVGRGPGLTPAGDDALAGFVSARLHLGAPTSALTDLSDTFGATGEPSRSLLRAAARGEVFAPVARMIAVVLAADGRALAPALRQLVALGRTTGRAYLTGIIGAFSAGDGRDG